MFVKVFCLIYQAKNFSLESRLRKPYYKDWLNQSLPSSAKENSNPFNLKGVDAILRVRRGESVETLRTPQCSRAASLECSAAPAA